MGNNLTMTASRQFVLCPDYDSALVVETAALDWLHESGQLRCNAWAGVSVRDDGAFGVLWGEPVRAALGDGLELNTEVLGEDGASNWADYVPDVSEGDAPKPAEGEP